MSIAELLAEVETLHRQKGRRLQGLDAREIGEIARAAGGKLPVCLHTVLMRAGARTNPFRMFSRVEDWTRAQARIAARISEAIELGELAPDKSAGQKILRSERLVAFAKERSECSLVLRAIDDLGAEVYAFDPETLELKRRPESFEAWLRSQWGRTRRDLEHARIWTVQFSFEGDPDAQVGKLAAALGGTLVGNWYEENLSSAGVSTWKRSLEVDGQTFSVGRMEYPKWPAPMLSVNATDSESEMDSGWVVRFRRAFESAGIKVKEIDYGLLRR